MKVIYQLLVGRPIRAVYLYRLSAFFYRHKLKPIGQLFWSLNLMLHSLEISPTAKIGQNLKLAHTPGIVIGGNVEIGNNVKIYQNVTLGTDAKKQYPIIEDNVTIYPGSVVIGGVVIGKGAVIAANSFVNADVAPYTVVGGSPAIVLKKRGQVT